MDTVENLRRDFYFEGVLCLDFANTADWHASDHPQERLKGYTDLVAWGVAAGLLSVEEAQISLKLAEDQPSTAKELYQRAIALREVLYRVFSAIAGSRSIAVDDLAFLNDMLRQAYAHLELKTTSQGVALDWHSYKNELERMFWQVIRSAVDLLTSDQLQRVGECADDRGCGYLFLDTSRNRSRRWCSMETCGNRAKAHRHFMKMRLNKTD
jgi:predicted RNA-binding Zn ribbon-like protein